MKNRLMSLILCLSVAFSLAIPVSAAEAVENSPTFSTETDESNDARLTVSITKTINNYEIEYGHDRDSFFAYLSVTARINDYNASIVSVDKVRLTKYSGLGATVTLRSTEFLPVDGNPSCKYSNSTFYITKNGIPYQVKCIATVEPDDKGGILFGISV